MKQMQGLSHSHRLKERNLEETIMEKVLVSVITASALCAVSLQAARQYHFVYEQKNMTEALSYCREKYRDLATIENMEDVNILEQMVDLNQMVDSEYRAWIGLYDDENSWRWSLSDGSFYTQGETEFRNWASIEPNNNGGREHCGVINNDGTWNDFVCGGAIPAVCADVTEPTVSKKLVKVKLMTRSSSLDLNHPAVMEDILKQLKQRLKDKGVNRDIKLSWKKQSDGKIFHKEKETKENIISKRDDL